MKNKNWRELKSGKCSLIIVISPLIYFIKKSWHAEVSVGAGAGGGFRNSADEKEKEEAAVAVPWEKKRPARSSWR